MVFDYIKTADNQQGSLPLKFLDLKTPKDALD